MDRNERSRPAGPVLAVCGGTDSDRTRALEGLIPRLVADGLAVAAVKHDADRDELPSMLPRLLHRHDVVLVEGHEGASLPKVWMEGASGDGPPADVTDVLARIPGGDGRLDELERIVREWLPRAWREPAPVAGVLIGGRSSRMGRPKHLLEWEGRTLLEHAVDVLGGRFGQVVLLGDGELPAPLLHHPRLPDPPGLVGPLAGILGALRASPDQPWVIVACDQPLLDETALDWLLDQRTPGVWAVLPRGGEGPEPLPALYDARARALLEAMAHEGVLAPRRLAEHPRAISPDVPPYHRDAWRGMNTRDEYDRLRAAGNDRGPVSLEPPAPSS
jgi:molybdopterin-guanine dinucleotide biosynthesis protein A